jgi:antitoxin FitA
MAQVLIRNLDDALVERMKLKAELNGHSLEQELRNVIAAAAPLTVEQKLALIDRAHALTPKGVTQTPAEDLIREDRDSR